MLVCKKPFQYARLYAPWGLGTNESWNTTVRNFVLKSMDMMNLSEGYVQRVEDETSTLHGRF